MKRLCLAAVLASAPAFAQQQDFSKVEIKATQVAGSVWMLEGSGGNIGVSAGEDGIVMVDDQFAPLVPKIKAALAKISQKPVRLLLNTHWHFDHVGGNAGMADTAAILAHENVRKRMQAGAEMFGRKIEPAEPRALPVITYQRDVTIWLNGEPVRALHVPPGHTDGDTVVFLSRDTVRCRRSPTSRSSATGWTRSSRWSPAASRAGRPSSRCRRRSCSLPTRTGTRASSGRPVHRSRRPGLDPTEVITVRRIEHRG